MHGIQSNGVHLGRQDCSVGVAETQSPLNWSGWSSRPVNALPGWMHGRTELKLMTPGAEVLQVRELMSLMAWHLPVSTTPA